MIARPAYSVLTTLAAPFIERLLSRRLESGKEDPERIAERRGVPSLPRPDGALVWVHAASNGEAMSALPLIERMLARNATLHVLITTGTLTSARLLADRLPGRAIHQFAPIDRTSWVRAFLTHWKPDAAVWVESEFWPALIWETRQRGVPTALVNGRVSRKSLDRWQRLPGLSKDLIAGFEPCLGQSETDAEALRALGAANACFVGNLKRSGAPLPVDTSILNSVRAGIGNRPVWLAASTHPGEEEFVGEAHLMLRDKFPDLLTILVPRHPARGEEIATAFQKSGLRVTCRTKNETITEQDEILIADTLGELGLFFRLAPVALIGGSLAGGHGGHNPLEAARLRCVPLFGPDMANFREIAQDLTDAVGAATVHNAMELANAVESLLNDSEACDLRAAAALSVAEDGTQAVDRVLDRLSEILPAPTCGKSS